MISLKRYMHVILIIVGLGGLFLFYSIHESRPANVHNLTSSAKEREFTESRRMAGGDRPRVWLAGDSEGERCGKLYSNVFRLCQDLKLTVVGEGRLDTDEVEKEDLVIFCDSSISRWADPDELAAFIAKGGRVILAAGFEEEESLLWPVFGIREMTSRDDFRYLAFEKPLLPVQSAEVCYDGSSDSVRLKVSKEADVYIKAIGEDVPILYTHPWKKGSVCVINGTFLSDPRCAGLLTGAISLLLPDFIYPVLGVKAVFLDDLPMITPEEDELCKRVYGYSGEGFVRDVMWPVFQGTSLRTSTPYTSSILAAAPSQESFETENDAILMTICKSALQFGGELTYAVECSEDGKFVVNQDFIDRFSGLFTGYTVQGLTMKTDNFSTKMLDISGTEIRAVRGML